MLALVALLSLPAQADPTLCGACCAAAGLNASATATCSQGLPFFGEGSTVRRDALGVEVTGIWLLACGEPATFDPYATRALDHVPEPGELLDAVLQPAAAHCFAQSCALPAGVCVAAADAPGRWVVVGCADGLSPGAAQLRASVEDRLTQPVVVIVEGRPIVAQRVTGASPPPIVAPVAPSAPTAPAVPPAPQPPAAPAAPAASQDEAIARLVAGLPADPPDNCRAASDLIREEARKRVDSGDEKRLRKDAVGAISEYRAALSMDSCNGYGWLGLGETATTLVRPDLAIRALRNATRLLPRHYGALALLGRNYENIGQTGLAAEAYRAALELSPTLAEAREGLRRIEAR